MSIGGVQEVLLNVSERPERLDYVEIQNVKIVPGNINFEQVFEGGQFKETIIIQNCGKCSVFVQILPPPAVAFQVINKIRIKIIYNKQSST